MRLELNLRAEAAGTFGTGVCFGIRTGGVSFYVLGEIILKTRFIGTVGASERFLPCMRSDVIVVAYLRNRPIAAVGANQGLLTAMNVHVSLQTKLIFGSKRAFTASKTFLHIILIA